MTIIKILILYRHLLKKLPWPLFFKEGDYSSFCHAEAWEVGRFFLKDVLFGKINT